jgi:hypothetical protein
MVKAAIKLGWIPVSTSEECGVCGREASYTTNAIGHGVKRACEEHVPRRDLESGIPLAGGLEGARARAPHDACPGDEPHFGPLAARASHATPQAAPQVPPAAQAPAAPSQSAPGPGACSRCLGKGFVMIETGDIPGRARRERCESCRGVGATRCNAEAKNGALCDLEPGHLSLHHAAGGLSWAEDYRAPRRSSRWRFLDASSGEWSEPDGPAFALVNVRELREPTHLCRGTPPMVEPDVGYAVLCPRDGWLDVTDVVTRNFVVPYEEHPTSAAGPELLGPIVERLMAALEPRMREIAEEAAGGAKKKAAE